jgi:hypothetical protein
MKLSKTCKALLASYGRSFLSAALAVYISTGDLKMAANALWAAALPVVMRYLNPNDMTFGKTSND